MARRTIAIVQARMGSSRFPGKMLAPFRGTPMLEWVVRRIRMSCRLDGCVVATSNLDRDTPLAELAARIGADVFRGDENDVLSRFVSAAEQTGAETVVRICGDRALVSPDLIDCAIETFAGGGADLVFNHVPELGVLHPYGMGAEVISAKLLHKIAVSSDDAMDREHVTWHVWRNRDRFRILSAPCPIAWQAPGAGMRFDVDTPADLADLERLTDGLDVAATAAELVRRRRQNPRD